MRNYTPWLALALAVVACETPASTAPSPSGDAALSSLAGSLFVTVDPATALSETWGGVEVLAGPTVVPDFRAEEAVLVVPYRTSTEIDFAEAFIDDSPVGYMNMVSPVDLELIIPQSDPGYYKVMAGFPVFTVLEVGDQTIASRIFAQPAWTNEVGTSRIKLRPLLRPVFVSEPGTPWDLRFRSMVGTKGSGVTLDAYTDDEGDPQLTQLAPNRWLMEWTPPLFALAADPPTDPVYFSLTKGTWSKSKTAGIRISMRSLDLASGPTLAAWPEPSCPIQVANCIEAADDGDLGSCGMYYVVKTCVEQSSDPCLAGSEEELELVEFDAAGLPGAVEAYNSTSWWGGISDFKAFKAYNCDEPGGAAFEDIVDEIMAFTSPFGADFWWSSGPVMGPAIAYHPFFSTGYSANGPALFSTMQSIAESNDGTAWQFENEVPCPNCTEFEGQNIVYFPSSGTVFWFSGTWGYDS